MFATGLLYCSERESSDSYLNVLNPLLDPTQLILGSGQHRNLRFPLKHTKHSSPDYEKILPPPAPARVFFCSEGSFGIMLGA